MNRNQLLKAYQTTYYICYIDHSSLKLQVGKKCASLAKILKLQYVDEAIFITAWNPYSENQRLSVNEKANLKLRQSLNTNQELIYFGQGRDRECTFFEDSFLSLGTSKEQGTKLAKQFGQNAYLYYKIGDLVQLVWTGS